MEVFASSLSPETSLLDRDLFSAIPRNSDSAVIYWNLSAHRRPAHEGCRLCLFIRGLDSGVDETIILHRQSGHFIVPLLARDRTYELSLGWSDVNGFRPIQSQNVILPEPVQGSLGAHSSALSYRGSHFWPSAGKEGNN